MPTATYALVSSGGRKSDNIEQVVNSEWSGDSLTSRLEREKITVQFMISIYCKGHHHLMNGLCSECQLVSDYSNDRLTHCKFGDSKPTCAKCTVHCYKPEMRAIIKEIMRYAGPKMLWNHPNIAVRHMIDGLKK